MFLELNEAQRRQLINAEAVFDALEEAKESAWKHRGSMIWREVSGRKYLVRTWPDSRQNSLGKESDETRLTYERFVAKKTETEKRLRSLQNEAEEHRRLNRALRLGRAPEILIAVLNALAKARVGNHFLIVGSNALFAYETAAGVRIPEHVMETRDADLLFDTARRASFLQVMSAEGLSLIDLLRKADKSFQRHESDNYTAVNDKGYEVDLIRRFPPAAEEATEHPLQMTPNSDDLWAVRVPTGQRLLSVPRIRQMVIGTSGSMASMSTVHPLDFARIKRELARDPQRDPRKASKDLAQADVVEDLVRHYLPQWAGERDPV